MDDLLIFSPNQKTHNKHPKHILAHMEELDLYLKLKKCTFNTPKVKYLGMIVKLGQITMDSVKLDGITSWPISVKLKNVHSFLSFANFYHHFISDYSTVTCPLLDLTKISTLLD